MTFASWNDYSRFAAAVKRGRRHIFDTTTAEFLQAVASSSKLRLTTLPSGTDLSRAQIAHEIRAEHSYDQYQDEEFVTGEFAMPCAEMRLRPYADRAREGRANPKGRPVFYATTDDDTAIAEVRPSKGTFVTLGYFKTTRDLQLVDCARLARSKSRKSRFTYALTDMKGGDLKMREESVWIEIEEAFAEPITASDEIADYLPTQIIAEVFMDQKYDGFVFNSSVGPGKNVVIFDLDQVELFESRVAMIKGITFDYTVGTYDGLEIS